MNKQDVSVDKQWMTEALHLAENGRGSVEPNPMVGCVLVTDKVVGRGWHAEFGGDHAEVAAIKDAQSHGHSTAGATAYVTLEPCCHTGKTGPCTEALIKAGISRVAVASVDPFPSVDSKGIELLRANGIQVDVGLLAENEESLNAPYRKLVRTQRPWVIAKWAMTLDGKIASRTGHSQWISSEASREVVHQIRGRVDAVIVGSGTALADDPGLDARIPVEERKRLATRIVIDSRARIELNSKLVKTAREIPVLIAVGRDADPSKCKALEAAGCEVRRSEASSNELQLNELQLNDLLNELGRRKMTNVLVEGGGTLLGSLVENDLIDEAHVFVSPKIVGGKNALTPVEGYGFETMNDSLKLRLCSHSVVDEDIYLVYRKFSGEE
jgi:diaminohydroxyphosphoribosylaminopyrimidine deaminase/5-amino-6-(5-phosphoribosylamino)uracil reductase